MDIGTAKPTAAGAGRGAAPPRRRRSTPGRTAPSPGSRARPTPRSPTSRPGARRALLVGGTGLYVRAVVDRLDIPGQYPDARHALGGGPDTAGLHRRLQELDPIAAARMEPEQPPSDRAGPRGHPRQRPAVLVLRPRPRRPPADAVHDRRAWSCRPRSWRRRIERRYEAQLAAGFVDEVRRLAERPERAPSPHGRPGAGLQGAARPRARARRRSTEAVALARPRAPAASPGASGLVRPRSRGSPGSTARRPPNRLVARAGTQP